MKLNRLILPGAIVATFLASFSLSGALAWPPLPYSMVHGYGYFQGLFDTSGDRVFAESCVGAYSYWNGIDNCNAIPNTAMSKPGFINFIEGKLANPGQDHTGAAFIIQTLIGQARDYNPTPAQMQDFRDRVNAANVDWYTSNFDWNMNTLNQRGRTGSGPDDVMLYWEGSTKSGEYGIVFFDQNWNRIYTIKTRCANPVGKDWMSPLPAPWAATGRSTVSDGVADPGDTLTSISTRPGDTVHFDHYIKNNGPGVSNNIWYSLYGHNDPTTNYNGQYFSNPAVFGAPTFTRSDPQIYFEWGLGGPGNGVPNDNFSATWTKNEYFTEGTYTFTATTDDGMQLFIDGALVIDAWYGQARTNYTANKAMTAGYHNIKWQYFELNGDAVTIFNYYNLTQGGAPSGTYASGEERLVDSDDVFVPLATTPGTKICRRILWSQKDSVLSGDLFYPNSGMGPQACATVVSDYP